MEIGDRVKATSDGKADHFSHDRIMRKGEEGIITNKHGNYIKIKSDDGTVFCRLEEFVQVIKPKQTNPNDYEIYG
jgi:hypothetical protein